MNHFLPVTREEIKAHGWDQPDFVYVTGDAYVDHPSFGHAIISRTLEHAGYRLAMLPQPDWKSAADFRKFGRPRLGFLVTAGVVDSMVNHYTAAKKRRSEDAYSPGGKAGHRPDRATIVYCNRIREAFGDIPIAIGGLEASLRRFAHYDYWDGAVRNSILVDSGADILMYGMGERIVVEVTALLASGKAISDSRIPGTCVMARNLPDGYLEVDSAETVMRDKRAYAKAFLTQYEEQDPIRGHGIAQRHGERYLVQHPPAQPLSRAELDAVYALLYQRAWHPMYAEAGGVPALQEVEFSLAHNRGCFGGCSFCALTFHQGRIVTSRSHESVIEEAKKLTGQPGFKGYIHDVGGPTANFRRAACKKQLTEGACKRRQCLYPAICEHVSADHSDYLQLLRALRELPNVKKVFIRSGIRYDYLMADKSGKFIDELARHHVSGQLKVAPEHVSPAVLKRMGKPPVEVFDQFVKRFEDANKKADKEQYLVPYFLSGHPGCTLNDAVALAEYIKRSGRRPEQVQDFYPTPGTLSTAMFYTGLDPRDMKPVYVPREAGEKAMQRALIQYYLPQNRHLVLAALKKAGRTDLIGWGPNCLIAPRDGQSQKRSPSTQAAKSTQTSKKPPEKAKRKPRTQSEKRKKR